MPATKNQVEDFLIDIKEKIKFFDIVFRTTEKNKKALFELDILPFQRLEIIKKLKVEDYYDGPKPDTFEFSLPDYFEFGITVKTIEVYIKINKGLERKPVDCMSFHPAEYTISYPFKKKKP